MLFFALYRERAGRDDLLLELPEGATVSSALDKVRGLFPGLAPSWVPIVAALNTEYAEPDMAVADGDELALIPPVSGGER